MHGVIIGTIRYVLIRMSLFEEFFMYASPMLVAAGIFTPLLMSRMYMGVFTAVLPGMRKSLVGTEGSKGRCSS